MREKYESLSLVVLKDLAKARGIKGVSAMKKSELIERMLQEDEEEKKSGVVKIAKDHKTVFTTNAVEHRERILRARKAEQEREESDSSYNVKEEIQDSAAIKEDIADLDSGCTVSGILEVMADGYGFLRCENYLPGEHDVYIAPSQIRRFNLKTGDIVTGNTKIKSSEKEKFSALLYVSTVNGYHPSEAQHRMNFEDMTPIFPNKRLRMERPGCSVAMRVVDVVSPIGKGQRGMIVSQPKAGKTTLLKEIANSVKINNPETLIDQ